MPVNCVHFYDSSSIAQWQNESSHKNMRREIGLIFQNLESATSRRKKEGYKNSGGGGGASSDDGESDGRGRDENVGLPQSRGGSLTLSLSLSACVCINVKWAEKGDNASAKARERDDCGSGACGKKRKVNDSATVVKTENYHENLINRWRHFIKQLTTTV